MEEAMTHTLARNVPSLLNDLKLSFAENSVAAVHVDMSIQKYKSCLFDFLSFLTQQGIRHEHTQFHVMDFFDPNFRNTNDPVPKKRDINVEFVVKLPDDPAISAPYETVPDLTPLKEVYTMNPWDMYIFDLFFKQRVQALLIAREGPENEQVIRLVQEIASLHGKEISIKEVPVISLRDNVYRESRVNCIMGC